MLIAILCSPTGSEAIKLRKDEDEQTKIAFVDSSDEKVR